MDLIYFFWKRFLSFLFLEMMVEKVFIWLLVEKQNIIQEDSHYVVN